MPEINTQVVEVSCDADITAARRRAKAAAAALGFAPAACQEIAIAITELATNLVKHAGEGKLVLTPLGEDSRIGLEIESLDNGPGIANIGQALADGFSSSGTLGVGFGAVNQLMDQFEITSNPSRGTRVVVRKWVPITPSAAPLHCPFDVGAGTRPHPRCTVNGDNFVIVHHARSTLVGIIDGLGHGQFAHRAANAAKVYVESHADSSLKDIFLGAGRACAATRGVVMALARFSWETPRLTFASLGNIEARVLGEGHFPFVVRRGIVGVNAPPPAPSEHPWPEDNLLVLHSDGLTTHWTDRQFERLFEKSATEIAARLLNKLAKDDDDATVLVVKKLIT